MPHNETSPAVFPIRFLLIFQFVLSLLIFPAPNAFTQSKPSQAGPVRTKTGIDVLEADHFEPLRGKRVGLITNQTGVDSRGRRTIDVLAHSQGIELAALFTPEHGIAGLADARIANASDAATGLPIFSLYGSTRRPTDDMLKNLDVLVFDIQGAGVRFYTYITTMAYAMEEAAKRHIAFIVLDRPDPLGGEVIEGPLLDPGRLSFTGYFPMPVRYGMTLGELALLFNAENKIGVDLRVIAMKDWHRSKIYSQTGLKWISPSPNLRTPDAAFLYPGIEILQAGGVSVGRGTDTPFEIFGAPWIVAADLVAALNRRQIPGVRFQATTFIPDSGIYSGQYCQGVSITITDRSALRSSLLGLEIAAALHRLYPDRFALEKTIELLGSQSTIDQLSRGDDPKRIVAGWGSSLDAFRALRQKYLLYDVGVR